MQPSRLYLSLLALLVSALSVVADSGNNHPLVDVACSARLETTFGLKQGLAMARIREKLRR